MKTVIGGIMIVVGALAGIYVGFYLMFIRGIVQLINSVTPEVIASGIAFGIVKIMFAGLVGWAVAIVLIAPGVALLED